MINYDTALVWDFGMLVLREKDGQTIAEVLLGKTGGCFGLWLAIMLPMHSLLESLRSGKWWFHCVLVQDEILSDTAVRLLDPEKPATGRMVFLFSLI